MNWSNWIRQFHRWVSIVFALMVAALFAVQGFGVTPAQWVFLTPLVPLFLLLFSGLYLFVLPYALRRRAKAA
jgi:hypothetical protein